MRISDWSSDVCSSDLILLRAFKAHAKSLIIFDEAEIAWRIGCARILGACRSGQIGQAAVLSRHSGGCRAAARALSRFHRRSEVHTSELQSLMRISYAVFCLKKKKHKATQYKKNETN